MAIFEFECPVHGKFEVICDSKYDTQSCPFLIMNRDQLEEYCGIESDKIEWSVPSRRNPEYGVQK